MINTGLINYNKPFTLANGSLTTDAALSTTLQNVKDQLGNSSPLRLATNRIALGSGTISGTALLNFPDAGTTAADGIQFGSGSSNLYRIGANSLQTNGNLYVQTGLYVGSSFGTFGNPLSIVAPIAHTPPTLTGSSATSALSISQTWNTTGNPSLIFANVTNTASGASANLMDLQVGGVSNFSISKGGLVKSKSFYADSYYGAYSQRYVIHQGGTDRAIISFGSATSRILLTNPSENNFDLLQFGGTTSSFPAIKRSSTNLQARLADDSGFTFVEDLYRRAGSGSPEGAVTAPVGATYHNTTGGAGTSFYVKESGTGNTGWVAK